MCYRSAEAPRHPKAEIAVRGETDMGLAALSYGRAPFDRFINYDGI